jgi:hypothetical protein
LEREENKMIEGMGGLDGEFVQAAVPAVNNNLGGNGMDDVTGSMLGILPPVIAAGAVMGIMNNMNGGKGGGMFGAPSGGGGMLGAPQNGGTRIDGSGDGVGASAKISLKTATKLFGSSKTELAKSGVEVTNADGDTLIYNGGNFYLLEAPELPRLM